MEYEEGLEGDIVPDISFPQPTSGFVFEDEDEENEEIIDDEEVEPSNEFYSKRQESSVDNRGRQHGNKKGSQPRQNKQFSGSIPELVKQFVTYFHRYIQERNVAEIQSMYENSWNKLTEKFFFNSPWPSADLIAPLVENDRVFLMLYNEMYYRHIYGKMSPTQEQRFASFKNYCDFFEFLLHSNADLPLELPKQWLWDIINEFIYQFQSFAAYSSQLKNKSEEELNNLKANPQIWSASVVIRYLDSIIKKSNIVALLEEQNSHNVQKGVESSNMGTHTLFSQLGYFSIIGLLRIHVMLADYHSALKTVAPIQLFTKGMFTLVSACYISLYYHVGYVYMVTRRFVDAIKVFTAILLFINRTRQYHTRSYQYDEIVKKNEKMFSLLAICLSICPQRVEENIHTMLRDKFSDKMQRIQKGEEGVIEELFLAGCPKFVSPCTPNYNAPEADNKAGHFSGTEISRVQVKVFVNEVMQQTLLPNIRSFLKLYSTIGLSKLAGFLEVDQETLREQLICYKHKCRTLVYNGGAPASGEKASSSDIDFFVDGDMIHIIDSKTQRRYSEFFLRHINKFDEIISDLEKTGRV
ncbi:hypothetical protein PROFUN_12837 [Planoprotostelium fungivorum]|uniref:Eukaryotic translation initiation factor 3 subunit L n=1 Tax=Planoprotostelium fungivorum TaxID=1890364 RepID=A0A2P6N6I7_9EUKA|nr:hypothetical protein PROFUN_12837 [Planoprotostelium fungivorum]